MPRAIIGLGNPGERYAKTRHNAGFMVLDELAKRWQVTFRPGKGSYVVARNNSQDAFLMKPATYMNHSGQAVRHLSDYFKISAEDCMLVFDDLDIPFPEIRLRKQGGAGTHRGVQSVIRHMDTLEFPRTRMGIGGSQGKLLAEDYVLDNYSKADFDVLPEQLSKAADAIEYWLKHDIDNAMNRYNVSVRKGEEEDKKEEKKTMSDMMIWVPAFGVLALLFAFWRTSWINKQDEGSETMKTIGKHIAEGAMAFLKAEYRILAMFIVAVAILLAFANSGEGKSPLVAASFIVGALASATAGFLGMRVATKANYRTAQAARSGLAKALNVAFTGGSVMGLSVVGLGVLGLGVLFLIYREIFSDMRMVMSVLSGFSLGASSIALFARVGGGIYTKAADVGADLVGKVEAGIPEDHPLNPATIADNVGDNVGDVAGMGADLFESYVGSIVGSMVLGATIMASGALAPEFVFLPLLIAAVGILVSISGTFMVSVKEGGDPQKGLNIGEFGSSAVMVVVMYFMITLMLPSSFSLGGVEYSSQGVFWATAIGLLAGLGIGYITEHYTGTDRGPVNSIVKQSQTGAATNLIAGLGVGMQSTAIPVLIIAASIMGSFYFAGLYGIAMAALGMLANTGIQLAVDAYGPISDNAGGIAEMAGLPAEVRQRTDKLDAVGNTTAAIGKGFAIGSAALTALALFAAFRTTVVALRPEGVGLNINITDATVMAGLFVGGMLPFLFSSMAMGAVGRAAMAMIEEVRRQFKTIPELTAALTVMRKYKEHEKMNAEDQMVFDAADGKAEYGKCVTISTEAAIREMMLPGTLAILTPVVIGYLFGAEALGGLLAGVTVTGVLMAIFQSNAGGAWDNAKKMVENGVEFDGIKYGKGSDLHKAAVVGDTVGDPFKDTSGPALNILIKLMSVVSLVIAPLIANI